MSQDPNKALAEQINALYTFVVLEPENAKAEGCDVTEWEVNFMELIWKRFEAGGSLSDRQVDKVEELFERYFG